MNPTKALDMDTEDGTLFIKVNRPEGEQVQPLTGTQNLASFIRTHEKALANSILQQRPQSTGNGQNATGKQAAGAPGSGATQSSLGASGAIASALTLGYLNFGSPSAKPGKLYLTPNQLYYLLSRFEELGVTVGPMNVRLENINAEASSSNYVSFLTKVPRPTRKNSDNDSIRSVSSVRSVMSSMSSMWPSFGLSGPSATKIEKQKAATLEDLRYLYSALTKIPWVKLAFDHRARRIAGYEEFPFDTAVPIHVFKNLTTLEIMDIDFRSFFGWDRLAEQLRSLTIKRACLDDPTDLLTNIVLDDMDKRRRRSAKSSSSPVLANAVTSPIARSSDYPRFTPTRDSPFTDDGRPSADSPPDSEAGGSVPQGNQLVSRTRIRSKSPTRPTSSRKVSSRPGPRVRRSSGSSTSSMPSYTPRNSSSNLLLLGILPHSKWRFLRHLCLADNDLTTISPTSLLPIANTLQSLDLSSNLFTEVPDSLSSLVALRALNLSGCLIDSLRSLARSPLPAITVLNLKGNRIDSLAGIEKLLSLERLDLRENGLRDPAELARLTSIPEFREVYIARNPLVKAHPGYRVTVFNLFRSSPGYTEDILIDASGPGYSERRQLADRAQEHVGLPVVRPAHDDDNNDETTASMVAIEPAPEADNFTKSQPPTTQHDDDMVRSQRRRKPPRRRIVDISQTETNPRLNTQVEEYSTASPSELADDGAATLNGDVRKPSRSTGSNGRSDATIAQLSPNTMLLEDANPKPLDTPGIPATIPDLSADSKVYKRKVQALKNDIGHGWLSALGDETRENRLVSPQQNFHEKEVSPRLHSPAVST